MRVRPSWMAPARPRKRIAGSLLARMFIVEVTFIKISLDYLQRLKGHIFCYVIPMNVSIMIKKTKNELKLIHKNSI